MIKIIKLTTILMIVLLLSCSTTKSIAPNSVLDTFLKQQVYTLNYKTIFVGKEPLPRSESITTYEAAFKEKDFDPSILKNIWIYPEIKFWPLGEKEISNIKTQISNDKPKFWTITDFNDSRIKIENEIKFNDIDFIKRNISSKNVILRLSTPIYSTDHKYALFEYSLSGVGPSGSLGLGGVVLMKKDNDRWVQTAVLKKEVYD
ncbi:hypothetical protein OGH69_04995 [Flavobacterium sp. MFBS3-15]|uniref:hypothetical protein n=1 Tax=Flavobacterium sp. MFBS3-15 TaxID=2989816 RepID=UPI002236AF6E|nr:hypothetical protein [Flavobacterium sp. MFBS3-15]MCW4468315.1 hypothetical protein [Flavobacterium sp. MFBS3-15]